jgi:hypothetical protein
LYDYAFHTRLIKEHAGILSLTTSGVSMLEEDQRVDMAQFVTFWLRLYKGAIPNLRSLVYWIESCSRQWVTVSSLYDNIECLIKPFFYDTPQSIFEERILKMMMHLGMVRIGEDGQRGPYLQSTSFGSSVVLTLQNRK